jgi:hypothetical protein
VLPLLLRDAAEMDEQEGEAGGELATGDGEGDDDDIRCCCSCYDARLAAAAAAAPAVVSWICCNRGGVGAAG